MHHYKPQQFIDHGLILDKYKDDRPSRCGYVMYATFVFGIGK